MTEALRISILTPAIFSVSDIYTTDTTNATKRIVVREEVWADRSGMREPGMTFSELIEGMIEHEKKRRLVEDIKWVQETEDLVEIPFCSDGG
ncbi:MAG: hypothetical protein GX880_10355 [Methanomicrobiales archaeon]|nr:hypothetical protein [Methanomicrobiales archaeon]